MQKNKQKTTFKKAKNQQNKDGSIRWGNDQLFIHSCGGFPVIEFTHKDLFLPKIDFSNFKARTYVYNPNDKSSEGSASSS
jgi:hypothetical protein